MRESILMLSYMNTTAEFVGNLLGLIESLLVDRVLSDML